MGGVILVNLVLVVCAFWVFVDAANNKIGVHTITEGVSKGYKSGISPVVWGLVAFSSCHLLFIWRVGNH